MYAYNSMCTLTIQCVRLQFHLFFLMFFIALVALGSSEHLGGDGSCYCKDYLKDIKQAIENNNEHYYSDRFIKDVIAINKMKEQLNEEFKSFISSNEKIIDTEFYKKRILEFRVKSDVLDIALKMVKKKHAVHQVYFLKH